MVIPLLANQDLTPMLRVLGCYFETTKSTYESRHIGLSIDILISIVLQWLYLPISEADLVCRQCLTEGINFFRKWKKLSEFSDLFGIAILLSVHVSCVASLCVSLYTYGLHW